MWFRRISFFPLIMLLALMPFCTCIGEIVTQPINMMLVSYDFLDRYKSLYASAETDIWLRYRIEYDEEQFIIEDIDILYSGPNENMIDSINVLSESDPAIFDYRFGYIRMKDHANESYIRNMIRDGYMTAQVLLRDRQNGDKWTVECDMDSRNAIMETETDTGAYEISISEYKYEEIDVSNQYLDAKLGMYIDTHPGIKCYRIRLYGTERRKTPYKAICGVEFYSLSPYLFIERDGGVGGVSVSEWLDAYDLLNENEKIISFEGILLADNADSIQERIQDAEIVVTYSTEYAGTFDTSDAGDRFHGPKMCESIVIVLNDEY